VILGIVFIKNFYLVFDADNDKIGVATHNVTLSKIKAGPKPTPIDNTPGRNETDPSTPVDPKKLNTTLVLIIVIILLAVMVLMLLSN
jgi:hypothetical protein